MSDGNDNDVGSEPLSGALRSNRKTPLNTTSQVVDWLADGDFCDADEETVPLTSRDLLLEPLSVPPDDAHQVVRSRHSSLTRKRRGKKRSRQTAEIQKGTAWMRTCLLWFCRNTRAVQSTISCMNLMARLLFWSSILASIAGVFWYSYELFNHG